MVVQQTQTIWRNGQTSYFDTSEQSDRESAHSAGTFASSYFILSGF